jgi:hypothetical protein
VYETKKVPMALLLQISGAIMSHKQTEIHEPDEYCVIDNMMGDAKIFVHIFLQPQGGGIP